MSGAVTLTREAEDYFEALAEELAVSEARYEQADESYKSLGRWLCRPESTVRLYDPQVYVQGSFRLGTTIRPCNEEEDYDVDSICEFNKLSTSLLPQLALKQMLGIEIAAYHRAQSMSKPVREGRRCWVLDYADGAQFHMDIVPALPNGQRQRRLLESYGFDVRWAQTAVVITDRESPNYKVISDDWSRSNPKGYAEWFKFRMSVIFDQRRRRLAEAARASVEDIPEFKVRTPLQSSIMILKRHRDLRFADNKDDRPISIILTTLAAHAYQSEEKIGHALVSILQRMDQFIEVVDGKYVIRNPTDPLENFADKWEKHPERARAFFDWLGQARRDFYNVAILSDHARFVESVSPVMGAPLAARAAARRNKPRGGLLRAASAAPTTGMSFPNQPRVPTNPQGFA